LVSNDERGSSRSIDTRFLRTRVCSVPVDEIRTMSCFSE
jgi:hypothetical protein